MTRLKLWLGAAAAAVIAGGVGIGLYWQSRTPAFSDFNARATLSSDMRYIYSQSADGDIVQYDLRNHVTKRILDTPRLESCPVSSPDGKLLAYVRMNGHKGEIWLMSLDHGSERRLTTGDDLFPSFDSSGRHLYFVRRTPSGLASDYAMWTYDLVTNRSSHIMADALAVDPKGSRLVLQHTDPSRMNFSTLVDKSRAIVRELGLSTGTAVGPDDVVAYLAVDDYRRSLWLSKSDGDTQLLLRVRGVLCQPAFDYRGRFVVVIEVFNGAGIAHVVDVHTGAEIHKVQLE